MHFNAGVFKALKVMTKSYRCVYVSKKMDKARRKKKYCQGRGDRSNERMKEIVSSAACTERLARTLPQDSLSRLLLLLLLDGRSPPCRRPCLTHIDPTTPTHQPATCPPPSPLHAHHVNLIS
ncbi:hypothetical protein Pcinc_044507 [Petrolisthes cinctipes]|uniref:Uncharacterized protein n=1 Tax=Petrolisthes cinctipes TaxID=88211 RepID=A0AAE1ETU5_PETCI|nr:hypothetical protein Pcinc_044507 [Petrolisthes cinctipes]